MLDRFAQYAVVHRDRPLSTVVEHAAVRAVVDWFASAVAGAEMPAPQILARALVDEGGRGSSRLVPSGRAVPVRTAALLNATAAHTAELDDIYRDGTYHPGAPTVAAALATAERLGASGTALLRAIVVGYEVGNRAAAAISPVHYRFWHPTGTVGTIGAATAVAELLALDRTRFAHALATATTMAAGLQQAFRSDAMSKPLHAGHAAEAGTLAAVAAAEGFTGALDVLDGPAGFGAAMAGSPDWTVAEAGLGVDQPTITQVTVKNHACCGHTFAAVDAAVALRELVDPDQVDRIEVATYRTAIDVAGNPEPRTEFEAKFSIPYCVAAALSHGPLRLRAFAPDRLADPATRALTARVTTIVDPDFDAAFPKQRAARVTVSCRDGSTHTVTRPTRKGDPDDPLTDAELRDKFDELVAPVLGAGPAAALATALWALPGSPDVRRLPLPGPDRPLAEAAQVGQ